MRIIDEIMPKIRAEARFDKDNKTIWIKTDTLDGYDRIIIEDGSVWCRIFYEDCGECAHNKSEQTENSSEKPNNYCDDCLYTDTCDSKEFFYACTSKATISKMEQVDKDINVRSKDEPQTYITEDRDTQILDAWQVHHRNTTSVEDEPQTEAFEEPNYYDPSL